MSTKYKLNFSILCPFNKGVSKNTIYCEGIYEIGGIINNLSNSSILREHMDLYCQCDWESCYIAKAIMMKYKEGEDR